MNGPNSREASVFYFAFAKDVSAIIKKRIGHSLTCGVKNGTPMRYKLSILRRVGKSLVGEFRILPVLLVRHFSRAIGLFIISALVLPARGYGADKEPPGYTVKGVIDFKEVRFSQERSFYYKTNQIEFELQALDCRWWIRLGTHDPKVYDYRIVSHVDGNAFLLLSYDTRTRFSRAEGKEMPSGIVADGTVIKGGLPGFDFAEEAGAVWLAYASSCDFHVNPTSERRQVPFARYVKARPLSSGDTPAIQHARWEISDQPPHLPTKVDYIITNVVTEAGYRVRSIGDDTNQLFTNVTFRTLSFTDFGGYRFPHEAVVSNYRLVNDNNDKQNLKVQLCQEMRVIQTNITLGVSLRSFKPQLPGKTIISEERFNNGSGLDFVYFATNNWPSEAAARNSQEYKRALAAVRARQPNPLSTRPNPIVLLAALLLIGVLPWLAIRARRRH